MGPRRLAAFAAVVAMLVLGIASSAQAVSRGAHRVTLVTGDRVVLTVSADGTQSVTVDDPSRNVFRNYSIVRQDREVFAIPVELNQYVGTLLDRDLFNVTKLVEQGYADRASGSIPLIVTHKRADDRSLPEAVTRTATLQSIDAVAGREPKAEADELGEALKAQVEADAENRAGPLANIETIHLDQQVKAALADSVPQIGAPQAWAAGFDGTGVDVAVLDTGADTSHPDLQGKVVAERNFTPEPSAADLNGHGTHVAATVAGTGAGADGTRRGVAPGARLMNGKVLDASGNGQVSWAIDAMEWAAANGAEIISMSMQAGFSDGTDPFAEAVNELTDSAGVLFTIASGNFGSGDQTVTTPGAASSALTVGAVDKANVLAGFSGRGPRPGDFAIKPDVTAPGVGIIAARAAGTSLGSPVDALYTMLEGTSMATPHVAGAAAILKHEYPDWTPQQIKAALVSTAVPGPYTVYQQGGGRVDVARAALQGVYSTTAPVDFSYFRYPHDDAEPVTKTITYANETAAAVTLDIAVEVPNAPAGMVLPSASQVTVPAGGTASVDLSVDVSVGDPALYGGYVTATGGDVVVRTPVGFFKEPESYDLRIDGIARDGRPARGISYIDVVDVEDTTRFQRTVGLTEGPVTLRVPRGTYSVMGRIFTYDEPEVYAEEVAIVGDPELEVTADASIVLDARTATELIVDTERPIETRSGAIGTYRAGAERGSWEALLLASPPIDRFFAAPTEPVTRGDFGFRHKPSMAAPEIRVDVTRPEAMPLDVRYATGSVRLDGTEQRQLVFVGLGRPEDYQGRDVRGKVALIARGGNIPFAQKLADATAAGAAAAIIHNNVPGLLLVALSAQSEIPLLTTSLSQGLLLQDLLEDGPVRVRLRGIADSPYTYDMLFQERGRILPTHRRTMDGTNSLRINADYHADVDGHLGGEAHHAYPAWSLFSTDFARNRAMPFTRTEYVAGADGWGRNAWPSMTNDCVFCGQLQGPVVRYPERGTVAETWLAQPQRPSVIRNWIVGDSGQPVTRNGNTISAFVPDWDDPEGRFGFADSRTDTATFRLYEDGELLGEAFGWRGDVTVAGEPATYRAELDVSRRAAWARYSTDTETAWTFRSAPTSEPQSLPLLLVDYDVGRLDSLNRAPRGAYEIDLRLRRQQGAASAEIEDVRVWASFDDGGTWRRLSVEDLGGGNYTAALTHPARQTARHVSLRVQAADSGGSRVTQTVMRAYGLE
jgi:subtilisin family serine protease